MAKAAIPRIMPAMMDSHGNPGIGGNAIGVETVLMANVVSAAIVVGVVCTVVVTVAGFEVVVEAVLEVT